MQCRLATTEDKPALYALWQKTFGDEPAVIDRFFRCITPKDIVVCGEKASPVSAVYMPRADLRCGEKTLSAAYIYAAATDAACRGRGLMTGLLQFAAENAQRQSLDGLFLVPAEPTLFDYYGARGFLPVFSKQLAQYSRTDLQTLCGTTVAELYADAREFYEVREQALSDIWHPAYPEAILDFSLFLNREYGANTLFTDSGYAVYVESGGAVLVTDFCCRSGREAALSHALLDRTGAAQYIFSLPASRRLGASSGKIVPAGMWQPLSALGKQAEIQNAYIGITLG